MARTDYTREKIALFVHYLMTTDKPVTVTQLCALWERYSGFEPRRQTIYDDLNAISIRLPLQVERKDNKNIYYLLKGEKHANSLEETD